MNLIKKVKYNHLVWIILFSFSLGLRLLGIGYGLPYEHNPNEHAYFGPINEALNEGKLDPGVQEYGYVFYYLTYFIGIFTRLFVSPVFVSEYEALFFRILSSLISSATVVVIYEISRRVYLPKQRSKNTDKILSFLPAAFLGISVTAVTTTRFAGPDNIVIFFLSLTVLSSISYLKSKNKKTLILTGALTAMATSLKFSYAVFMAYPAFIYLLANNFEFGEFFKLLLRKPLGALQYQRKKVLTSLKYGFFAGLFYFLINIPALFHLKTWLGLNYFVMTIYTTSNHFYFKTFHPNYFDSLFTYIKFIFSDFYIVTNISFYISLVIFLLFLYQCFIFFKSRKMIFLALLVFPLLVLLLSAKAVVFQIRNTVPIAPLFLLVIFYPTKITRHLLFKSALVLILIIGFASTFNRALDIQSRSAERDLMAFVEKNQGVYAFPNILYYPQILYAYYETRESRDFSKYPFFRDNSQRIIFYHQKENYLLPNAKLKPSAPNPSENISEVLGKVDYFVTAKYVLETVEYKVANRLKLEPSFNQVDIDPNFDLDKLLADYKFKLVATYQSSNFETVPEYDPTHSGFVQIYIYRHEK